MFLSPIFLIGILAIGLPIAIHLLTRQKSKSMAWGAMEFLNKSINSASSRRQRLRDRVLLLLRALAILFVILAFAQPLTSRLMTGSQTETILIWDVSMSTSAIGQDGAPRQDKIRQALLEEIEGLSDEATIRILLAGAETRWLRESPLILSPNNRANLVGLIEAQKMDQGGGSIAAAILLAINSPSENSQSKYRNIVVFNDLQEHAWQPNEKNRWSTIYKRIKDAPNLTLERYDLGRFTIQSGPQAAVVSLEADRDTVATGSKQRFRAILQNFSDSRIVDAKIIWYINQREVERQDFVSLSSNSRLSIEQILSIEDSGSQVVECRLEVENDPLQADNSAFLALWATNQLPILIVDDTQIEQKGQILPSQFIVASLGGHLGPKNKKAPALRSTSIFSPRVIRSKDLGEAELDRHIAVIIAHAESLPSDSNQLLKDFVASGRGLWLMMSENNGALPEWTAQLLRSLDLDSMSETSLLEVSETTKPLKLASISTNSAYVNAIAAKSLDLSKAKVTKLHQLDKVNFLATEKLLQTPSGKPVILSIPAEPGRVILQMCDLNRNTTNLPILQTFVPIMRETMRECVGRGISAKNLEPGQIMRVVNSETLVNQTSLIITRPDGSTEQAERLAGEFQTANTYLPGRYVIRGSENGEGKSQTQTYVVRRPEQESKLTFLDQITVNQLIDGKALGSEELEPTEYRGKWSLAIFFAILAGVFFLAEALLAHRLAKRRESASGRIELKPVY